jgi:hypothetical protein
MRQQPTHDCPGCTALATVIDLLIDGDLTPVDRVIKALECIDDPAAAGPLARLKCQQKFNQPEGVTNDQPNHAV